MTCKHIYMSLYSWSYVKWDLISEQNRFKNIICFHIEQNFNVKNIRNYKGAEASVHL